jgi:hypothetical protein
MRGIFIIIGTLIMWYSWRKYRKPGVKFWSFGFIWNTMEQKGAMLYTFGVIIVLLSLIFG